MSTKTFPVLLIILFVASSSNINVRAQEEEDKVSNIAATVDCREIGRLNGEVQYQYEVTLTNNTGSKQLVAYDVIFMAGDVRLKTHKHSTLMIPHEKKLTETHDGKMRETDWDRVTKFRIEWSSKKQT
jgi:hypothetical protein